MSLHDRIMAKRCRISIDKIGPDFMREAYKDGYKQCKKEAAQLATEADELMAEMAEALELLDLDQLDPMQEVEVKSALAKYNTYMERNNEQ